MKERQISGNAALEIERFRDDEVERDYLRLHEIPVYPESCSEIYLPVAEVLSHSGLRVSEAIGLQLQDLELSDSGGAIVVYRSRKLSATRQMRSGSTKSDKFRRVGSGRGAHGYCQIRWPGVGRWPMGINPRPSCS